MSKPMWDPSWTTVEKYSAVAKANKRVDEADTALKRAQDEVVWAAVEKSNALSHQQQIYYHLQNDGNAVEKAA